MMFGIGFQEILLILLIALVIFGPKKLPDLARSLGKGVAEFKKAAEDMKKSFEEAVEEEDLKDEIKELKDMGNTLEREVKKGFTGDEARTETVGKDRESEKEGKDTEVKEKESGSSDEG